MKKILVAAALATASLMGAASANASPSIVIGVDRPGVAVVDQAQYVYYGHRYCWYEDGWRGPGWYWCGYAYRRGWGWGGPGGWRGWYSGSTYWRGGAWIGPRDYHHREWGGWHEDGRRDGDRRDRGWHDRGWHDRGGHEGDRHEREGHRR